jgi:hypothetical protein
MGIGLACVLFIMPLHQSLSESLCLGQKLKGQKND